MVEFAVLPSCLPSFFFQHILPQLLSLTTYYNIVHKAFQVAILRKLSFFQDGVTHVSDNTEYKMF